MLSLLSYHETPFSGWWLAVERVAGELRQIDWIAAPPPSSTIAPPPLWLVSYLAGDSIPIDQLALNGLTGTPFQLRVWQQLRQIPLGQLWSYGALAERLASSPRAVAHACRVNPLALVIPCHRVVSRHGWGGYMGATEGAALELKQQLIQHEQHYAATQSK